MSSTALLPASSLARVTTHRLTQATIVWRSQHPLAASLHADDLYCSPVADEASALYDEASRTEWADRYGGTGIGGNGGSGRCSAFNGVQTKGVGRTPLVDPQADAYHSSGTLLLREAAAEAVFAEVYQLALPFGAVPTLALAHTGSRSCDADHPDRARLRALAYRPFVARPAHFMRCLYDRSSHGPHSTIEPGWSFDATRTRQALGLLAANLQAALHLADTERDPAALLDAGLRELARRSAWQCAATFAKRLPHGTLSCSNVALDGAFLDFGLAQFLPGYRRRVCANGQDPWTEANWPLRTLLTLRDQVVRYAPHLCGDGLVRSDELQRLYDQTLQQRLAVEMAKMSGLTEDMALACPPHLLSEHLAVLRTVWTRGADECFSPEPGAMADGQPAPTPRRRGHHDLSAILAAGGACGAAPEFAERLNDSALRQRLINTSQSLCRWLTQHWCGPTGASLGAYMLRQAQRKNASLNMLLRDATASLAPVRAMEWAGDAAAIGPAINQLVQDAAHTLADLDPGLPGRCGREQLESLHSLR